MSHFSSEFKAIEENVAEGLSDPLLKHGERLQRMDNCFPLCANFYSAEFFFLNKTGFDGTGSRNVQEKYLKKARNSRGQNE